MANLRIIFDNAADRATVAASTTASGSSVQNVQNDYKTVAHRSNGPSVTYTLTWASAQSIGGLHLQGNYTADATIRVRLYSDAAGTTLVADSGVQYACPGLDLGMWDWTQPLNANAFAFGGISKTSVWFPAHHSVRRAVIDVVDTNNPAGYIDTARIVAGGFWSPEYNAGYGVEVSSNDTSTSSRNDSGDLLATRGTKHDVLKFSLENMPETDRGRLMQLLRNVGTAKNFFISLVPDSTSPVRVQDYMVYGNRSNASLRWDWYNGFSNSIDLEGW